MAIATVRPAIPIRGRTVAQWRDGTMKSHNHEAVMKEYKRRAPAYDVTCRQFLSLSHRVAIETLNPRWGEKILDAGCGTGEVTSKILQKTGGSGEVVGVDLSQDMLSIAREKLLWWNRAILIRGNLESISYPDDYFDGVVSVNVMHYLHSLEQALKEFHRLLRPGGRLVLVGFCTDYVLFALVERIWRILMPAHVRAYPLGELSRALKESGFESVTGKRLKIGWFWGAMVIEARTP